MDEYNPSLATTAIKTFALEAATMALNSAISFGVSFLVTGALTAIDNLIHGEERLAKAKNLPETMHRLSFQIAK